MSFSSQFIFYSTADLLSRLAPPRPWCWCCRAAWPGPERALVGMKNSCILIHMLHLLKSLLKKSPLVCCVCCVYLRILFLMVLCGPSFLLPRGPLRAFLSQRPASAVIFIVLTLIITLLDRNLAFRLCGPSRTFKWSRSIFHFYLSAPWDERGFIPFGPMVTKGLRKKEVVIMNLFSRLLLQASHLCWNTTVIFNLNFNEDSVKDWLGRFF